MDANSRPRKQARLDTFLIPRRDEKSQRKTTVMITPVDTQTTESPREEIFSTAEIPTNANHTQATREEISPAAETSDNSGHTQHTCEDISFTEETSSNERYTQQSTVQEQQTTASTDTSMGIERTIGIEDITVNTTAPSTVPEIKKIDNDATNEIKYKLILYREPEATFQFPSKLFCDKRRASRSIKRHCCREWFRIFDFLSYSKIDDGLYCLACRLFPDTSHRRPTKLISEPYDNWKKAVDHLKSHATTDYHQGSLAKLKAFQSTYLNPSTRVDVTITHDGDETIRTNKNILKSIVKSLLFCGRQGIALRGHRDDDTEKGSTFKKGNLKELLNFRVDAGDKVIEEHIEKCAKNDSYTSKTSQNQLLLCMKKYIQNKIVDEVKNQTIGPYYGIQCDDVTDSSNWEQLGIVLRYTINNRPVERLLEFVACENITEEEICNNLIESLSNAGLDTQYCRSQTMDGAGNMSGKYNGCAAKFREHSSKAVYHYCSSHDLNLVLCKSSQVKEIHIILEALKQLGIFFKYSPKRCRRLEKAVEDVNAGREADAKITNTKLKIFCETRWVEKFTTLHVFDEMYEPLLCCLEAIGLERGWDSKAVTESNGMLKRMTDPTFIVCFQSVLHFYGYFSGLSKKLQGSSLDVLQGYKMVELVKDTLLSARSNDTGYNMVFDKAESMAEIGNVVIALPRHCGRQTERSNVPGDTPKVYFKRAIYLPFLDSLIQQYNTRFNSLSQKALNAMALIPAHLHLANCELVSDLFTFFKDDLHYLQHLIRN